MSDTTNANRRIHTRHSAKIAARLVHATDAVDGSIENIGEGGVFFATQDLEMNVEEGDEVTVAFRCRKGGQDMEVERLASVLRTERYFDGEAVVRAFAIKFAELMPLEGVEFA